MAIRIDEINVERAGPIAELQLILKQFNLIYGHNEQGKTFLVEFVIRSLFKNLSGWSLRDSEGQGNVVLSGLDAGSTVTLRPSSGVKLEELLMDKQPGLPPRISKLLVVKGADLSFDDKVKSGVRRDDLKDFLSGQGILDIIEKNISKVVQKAKIENDRITGRNQGEISTRKKLAAELEQIDGFFEQIEALYSGGERQALQSSIDELFAKISNQKAAKRHEAYELSQSIREQLDQLERLPQADLDALKADYNKYQESENRLDRQEVKLDDLTQRSQGYEWLEEAISIYEKRGTRERERVSPLYPIVIVLALILAVASSFIGYPLGTVLLILVAVVFGGLVVRQYRTALEQAVASEEINKIDSEFENRFGQPLSGLPELKEKKKSMEAAYFGLDTVREEQKEERAKLEDNEDRMRMGFMNLVDKSLDREDWESELKELTDQRDQLQRQLNSTRLKLATLDIPESEFQEAPAADEYSKESLEGFKLEFSQLEERLRIETEELNNLKAQINTLTKDDISVEWETSIQHLQAKRVTTSAGYRNTTARILAGILVNEQLELIRAQEEVEIKKGVESAEVVGPVNRITGIYSSLNYDDGKILVNDEYKQFALSNLSTGAREQVLLGLRLGFAARLLRDESLFLLLDDAFQHADWERRDLLIAKMVDLAKEGWQIVYFTMDDDIRDRFMKAGQQNFTGQFMYRNINPEGSSPPVSG